MKSKLLTKNPGEEFLDGVVALSELELNTVKELSNVIQNSTDEKKYLTDEEVYEIAKKHNVTVDSISKSFASSLFIIKFSEEDKDSIDDILFDLKSVSKLDEKHFQNLQSNLNHLETAMKSFITVIMSPQKDISTTFPTLGYYNTTVAITTKFNQQLKARTRDLSKL